MNMDLIRLTIAYLLSLIERFRGGPVGLNALASSVSEDITTLEDVYEPYLLQEDLLFELHGEELLQKKHRHLGIQK